jgi:hypothetical protein
MIRRETRQTDENLLSARLITTEKGAHRRRNEAQERMTSTDLIDNRALQRAILVGTFLQIIAVLIAHFSHWIETNAYLFAGMMISATMGYLYAQDVARGYAKGAYGGAIAGGICAFAGIAVTVVLGDLTGRMLIVRSLISVLTGAVGGVYGQMAADWR